ncbi:MAG: PD-(D/E)XK nuclease domain-containing protein, partial [Succinivibrio sp.]
SRDNANLEILEALAAGDAIKAQELLQRLLGSFVSVRAFAAKAPPENFYEGFVTGVLSSLGDALQDLRVEYPAGGGYADIMFRYSGRSSAMVFELKIAGSVSGLAAAVHNGLRQIEEKHYAAEYVADPSIINVTAVGIAFLQKSCVVATKALKGGAKNR